MRLVRGGAAMAAVAGAGAVQQCNVPSSHALLDVSLRPGGLDRSIDRNDQRLLDARLALARCSLTASSHRAAIYVQFHPCREHDRGFIPESSDRPEGALARGPV